MRRKTPRPKGIVPAVIGARVRALHVSRQVSETELGARYATRARVTAVDLGNKSPVLKTPAHLARAVSAEICDLTARGL
jgi:hypothetical protein